MLYQSGPKSHCEESSQARNQQQVDRGRGGFKKLGGVEVKIEGISETEVDSQT